VFWTSKLVSTSNKQHNLIRVSFLFISNSFDNFHVIVENKFGVRRRTTTILCYVFFEMHDKDFLCRASFFHAWKTS
jgi:hypothetical protein